MPFSRRTFMLGAAGVAAAATASAVLPAGNAHAASDMEVIADEMITDRLRYLRFKTPQINWNGSGPGVNVLLPSDYDSGKRYPVLYLLHGGAGDFRQFHSMGIEGMTDGMIVVMPDGGTAGWYCNPVASMTGAKNWETFHMSQLVPWIDQNLRTHAEFAGRAVGGFSMGGFGALKYTAKYYGHFSSVTSFSGPADIRRVTGNGGVGLDGGVVHWANLSAAVDLGTPTGLYGAPWDQKRVSMDNAVENIERFRGKRVAFYSGDDGEIQESTVRAGHEHFSNLLNQAGIDHRFVPFHGNHSVRREDLQFELDAIRKHLRAAA